MNILFLAPLAVLLSGVPEEADSSATSPAVFVSPDNPLAFNESPTEEDFYGYFLRRAEDGDQYSGSMAANLSFVRYRHRGYDNRYNDIKIGNSDAIDISDGIVYWNMLSAARSAANLDRTRLSYSLSDGNYTGRVTAGTSIKSRDNSLNSKLFFNTRFGKNPNVDGLKTNLTNIAATLNKKFSKQEISFLYAGNYGSQDVRSAATQEVYNLSGDNYCNPNWGYQKGDIRNSKSREYAQNFISLDHSIDLFGDVKLKTTVSSFFGKNSFSLLTWYDAPTPYPDYYRYLSGFFGNPAISGPLTEDWAAGNPDITQINWSRLYEANILGGGEGEKRSHYVVRDLVSDKLNLSFKTKAEYRYSKELLLTGGIEANRYASSNYAKMDDLLGGDYWIDIDQYLLDDEYYGDKIQNDVRNPNRRVRKGDKFGYNYDMTTVNYRAAGAIDYADGRWSVHAGLSVGSTTYTRDGKYEKEMFPGNLSYGKSQDARFNEYSLKGNVARHLSLRHSVSLGFVLRSMAPLADNFFISPEYRNQTIADARTVKMAGVEAGYSFMSPQFSFKASGYYTKFMDDSYVTNYYDDLVSEYANLIMTGIDKAHAGAEISLRASLTPALSVTVEAAYNVFKYDSDANVEITSDKDGQTILSNAVSYIAGYRLPGMPEIGAVARMSYRFPARWTLSGAVNYASGSYVALNPLRRMSRVLDLAGSPEIQKTILQQEQFGDVVTADITLAKDFRMRNGQSVGLWLNISNVLDNKDIKYGGYEQMRFSRTTQEAGRLLVPFKNKFYYGYGRTCYLILSYTF